VAGRRDDEGGAADRRPPGGRRVPPDGASLAHAAGSGLRLAVAVSRFNERITRRLLAGAQEALARCGVAESHVDVEWTPGAWELPILAQTLARTGRYDAIVCLGCVIRGETTHDRIVGLGAMTGLARVALDERVPVTLGVLTVQTMAQAEERSGGAHGNKGEDAALAAVEMAALLRRVRGEDSR
jgi:6,7-dimethyl-8-ribityllumazine synthase